MINNGYAKGRRKDVNKTSSTTTLECYNDVCFVSDIKTTTCRESSETHLTPLPIPGLYYKYIDRPDGSLRSSNDTKNKEQNNSSNNKKKGGVR